MEFKDELFSIIHEIETLKNKNIENSFENAVNERLSKSLTAYENNVLDIFEYIMQLNPLSAAKKIKNILDSI